MKLVFYEHQHRAWLADCLDEAIGQLGEELTV
jgi:hypothetical protein